MTESIIKQKPYNFIYFSHYFIDQVSAVFSRRENNKNEPLRRFLLALTNLNFPVDNNFMNTL